MDFHKCKFNKFVYVVDEYISEELRPAPGYIQPRGLARDNVSFFLSHIFLETKQKCI
jgi:hypothetical protein